MDSINRNQPEDNLKDLAGAEAVERIREMVKKTQSGFFCTRPVDGGHGVRPMNVRKVDDQGVLWFLSADDSHKNVDLATDPMVRMYFQEGENHGFLHLDGKATVSRDKAKIRELWEPILKTWFTEGEDDPRITVIAYTPTDGYYWDTKHGNVVAGVKMLIGAAIGKTLDDSIEGELRP